MLQCEEKKDINKKQTVAIDNGLKIHRQLEINSGETNVIQNPISADKKKQVGA